MRPRQKCVWGAFTSRFAKATILIINHAKLLQYANTKFKRRQTLPAGHTILNRTWNLGVSNALRLTLYRIETLLLGSALRSIGSHGDPNAEICSPPRFEFQNGRSRHCQCNRLCSGNIGHLRRDFPVPYLAFLCAVTPFCGNRIRFAPI